MLNIPQEFLQEEIREDFTVDVTMKSCWAAQLEVLREISEICERHNLQWFCAYGTLLGAVRHQGFIPWDDDMDIWMLREDYTKFLQVAKAELPEEYRVDSPLTEEGYTEYHTLILNAGSISIRPERLTKFHGCPFATGVDIFPLDYLPRDEADRKTLLEVMALLLFCAGIVKKEEWEEADIEDIANGRKAIEEMFNLHFEVEIEKENTRELITEFTKVCNLLAMSYGEEDGDELVMYPLYIQDSRQVFAKEWFLEAVDCPFESFLSLPIPNGAKEILTVRYGDYNVRVKGTAGHDYPLYKRQMRELEDALRNLEDKVNRLEELKANDKGETC